MPLPPTPPLVSRTIPVWRRVDPRPCPQWYRQIADNVNSDFYLVVNIRFRVAHFFFWTKCEIGQLTNASCRKHRFFQLERALSDVDSYRYYSGAGQGISACAFTDVRHPDARKASARSLKRASRAEGPCVLREEGKRPAQSPSVNVYGVIKCGVNLKFTRMHYPTRCFDC